MTCLEEMLLQMKQQRTLPGNHPPGTQPTCMFHHAPLQLRYRNSRRRPRPRRRPNGGSVVVSKGRGCGRGRLVSHASPSGYSLIMLTHGKDHVSKGGMMSTIQQHKLHASSLHASSVQLTTLGEACKWSKQRTLNRMRRLNI